MRESSPSSIHIDAALSPAVAIPGELLRLQRPPRAWPGAQRSVRPQLYDDALRWLAASDRIVSDHAARALLEVKEGRLHVKEGHARWSTYLRAFVPLTVRWCQQEMRRLRALRDHPLLAAAWAAGSLGKSQLRVVLRVVSPETEGLWLERALRSTVRELENLVAQEVEADAGTAASWVEIAGSGTPGASVPDDAAAPALRGGMPTGKDEPEADKSGAGGFRPRFDHGTDPGPTDIDTARLKRRVVMAPPGVALLVSTAVEVARKKACYQIGIGAAVEMMAMETMAGLHEYPGPGTGDEHGAGGAASNPQSEVDRAESGSLGTGTRATGACGSALGDHQDLRRELGAGWELVHQAMEDATGRWSDLPSDLRQVFVDGAPADDSGAHERVIFWTGLQGRLDAVRGRLLRIVEESFVPHSLGFAGFGQYVRERMGLGLRDADELVRLDRALERLPVAFSMYASGRLGKRASWLVSRVAIGRTDRDWVRFAMTHTLRLLEAVVEAAQLKREVDPEGWKRDGGMPPQDATFADAIRACSYLKAVGSREDATARVEFLLDPDQQACYEETLRRLRRIGGEDRPEWWGLAVMARHFLNCYADEDNLASPARLRRMFHRRIVERDGYTCLAPECLQRGGLEADHVRFRSHGGPTTFENMISLCAADHRFMKHTAGTLTFAGEAPDRLTARMGSRVYLNDRLIEPALSETTLDEDPWSRRRCADRRGTVAGSTRSQCSASPGRTGRGLRGPRALEDVLVLRVAQRQGVVADDELQADEARHDGDERDSAVGVLA